MAQVLHRPFADAAIELAERGLAVIPCPGADGKSPAGAVDGFNLWRRPLGKNAIAKLAKRWGDANIGIITSLSGVTVVDVDGNIALTQEIIRQVGDTPLVTRTPSGGAHLWYKSNGERNANLRSIGLPVDIKGAGTGIIIVPPSLRPSTGLPYIFERGSWDDLKRLPGANLIKLAPVVEDRFDRLNTPRGQRNDQLFRHGLREARHCDDVASLYDVLATANELLREPLPDQEIGKIARSVWGYQSSGKNWSVVSRARSLLPVR